MAVPRSQQHSEQVHNGPTTQTPHPERCCGSNVDVVRLTGDDATSLVELVRCSACGQSSWRLDGRSAAKDAALGALSAAFAPSRRHQPTTRTGPRPTPSPAPPVGVGAQLSDLLVGWQVLGTSS